MKTKISLQEQRAHRQSEGWFYVIMAIIVIAIAIAGFGPTAVSTASRRAPLTWALVSHGAIFGVWLLLFLTQTILVTKNKIALHRRLGYLGALFAVLMVLSGYITAIAMARRGYDLSGDLIQGNSDPLELLVFQLEIF
jgi:ABC-type Na+ efflux pump permease subunit